MTQPTIKSVIAAVVGLLVFLMPAAPVFADASQPCTGATPPAQFEHVVVVVMENRSLSDIDGNQNAPYLNNLIANCGLAVNYQHVGTGNADKILMTAGVEYGYNSSRTNKALIAAPNIFSQTGNWSDLAENMPKPCDRSNGNGYVFRHNPAIAFKNIAATCWKHNRKLTYPLNLSAQYTMIIPAMGHSMHPYAGHTSQAALTSSGDAWLSTFMPKIFSSPQYAAGNTAVFIVWDEGGTYLPCIVMAPSVIPGTRSDIPASHIALLRTTQDLLGLPSFPSDAGANSMAQSFNLK